MMTPAIGAIKIIKKPNGITEDMRIPRNDKIPTTIKASG
jgi:hypothetical protein